MGLVASAVALVPASGGGPTPLHYLDTATGADTGQPTASMGSDWSQVVVPAAGWGIRRINNEWGIEFGSTWHTAKNNVAAPTTTQYTVGIKITVAGGLHRVYANPRVYAEYNGAAISICTCATDFAASGTQMAGSSTATATLVAGDVFSIQKSGNIYTAYKNGVATAATGTDSGGTYAAQPFTTGVGLYAAATSYRFDNFAVDDV